MAVLLVSCTHLALEDCPPGDVLGRDVTRIRSSRWRMQVADTAAAGARFAPWALMSALAYASDERCPDHGGISATTRQALETMLAAHAPAGAAWARVPEFAMPGRCEDERGLFLEVWQRATADGRDVAMVFRGTSPGWADWPYGNLWWFTRFVLRDNQYSRARRHAARVLAHDWTAGLPPGSTPRVRVFTAGHSLGGGLAQHVLYAFPHQVLQALTFDPSPVTGFVDVGSGNQLAGCACETDLGSETRILRVYESYEVLANVRIFHKIFFPPHRHVQEVRFAFSRSLNVVHQHSMANLATRLHEESTRRSTAPSGPPWFASPEPRCTARFEADQRAACAVAATAGASACPP